MLAPVQRRDLMRAIRLLFVARCTLALVPLSKILERKCILAGTTKEGEAARIAWALATASRFVPWRSDCLIQAIAAMTWAERFGLSAQMHLGVRKSGQSAIEAHAWVTSGDTVLSGALPDLSSFQELEAGAAVDGDLAFRMAS